MAENVSLKQSWISCCCLFQTILTLFIYLKILEKLLVAKILIWFLRNYFKLNYSENDWLLWKIRRTFCNFNQVILFQPLFFKISKQRKWLIFYFKKFNFLFYFLYVSWKRALKLVGRFSSFKFKAKKP